MSIGHACTKIFTQQDINEEQTMMYLKLRDAGCGKQAARRFCGRKICQVDQTQKKFGPNHYKIITPLPTTAFGSNGWQPGSIMKYDLGEDYRMVKDLDMKPTTHDQAILNKYLQVQKICEEGLKQKINNLESFMDQNETQINIAGDTRESVLQSIRDFSDKQHIGSLKPRKYFKYRGLKYFHIVQLVKDEVESQYNVKLNDQLSTDKYSALNSKKNNSTAIIPASSKKKKLSLKKIINQEFDQSRKTNPQTSSVKSLKLRSIHVNNNSIDLLDYPLYKQDSVLQFKDEKKMTNAAFQEALAPQQSLENLNTIHPFQSFYNLSPNDISIQHQEAKSPQCMISSSHVSVQQTYLKMKRENQLIKNLLDQNGISDCLDLNKIVRNGSQPPQGILEILKQQGGKQEMADEFNKTQYIFKTNEPNIVSNQFIVIQNFNKNGENINNISLRKSELNKRQNLIDPFQSVTKSPIKRNTFSGRDLDNDYQQSFFPSPLKSQSKQMSYSGQWDSLIIAEGNKPDHEDQFASQIKTLISNQVLKMNQRVKSIVVDDTQLKDIKQRFGKQLGNRSQAITRNYEHKQIRNTSQSILQKMPGKNFNSKMP